MYEKILIVVFGLIMFSACSQVSEEVGSNDLEENELETTGQIENDLVDTEWVLMLLNGEQLLEGTNITLAFYLSELSGFAGCNGYGSQYEIYGIDGIRILEIESQA